MKNAISNLSEVFPPETTYFYGFPTEWDSNFYNACPATTEELVAMRPAVCAGPDVRIVTFSNTVSDDVWRTLQDDFGVPLISKDRIIALPGSIDTAADGKERNNRIRDALAEMVPNGRFVMAQPYTEKRLEEKYLIQPSITTWLNDKHNIRHFVPEEYRTPEYANVANGDEFAALDESKIPYPCVIKVSASSAGDGVRVCKSVDEFRAAQVAFKQSKGAILVQKFVDYTQEIDVKFVIHPDSNKPFELVGHSQEITGTDGDYMGGIITNQNEPSEIVRKIYDILETQILPALQAKGWFGIGGVDVLIDKDGKFHFNDFNCRMTAAAAQTLQVNSGLLGKNHVLFFNGTFDGTLNDFRRSMAQKARHGSNHHMLNVVSLTHDKNIVRMHAGALFDQQEALREVIAELQSHGIQSDIFEQLKKEGI